jgi:MerR family transcriptional regulator/heat shock protein HspR
MALHDQDKPVYTISVVAELIGCHPRTLRIYEEEGLVHPKRKNNVRRYSERDVMRIKEICELMDEWSLNLSAMRAMFEMAQRFHIETEKMIHRMLE